MLRPSYLKKGDRIGILAPARKVSPEEIKFGLEVLTSWGLDVVLAKNLFKNQNQFSGSDPERAEDLQTMLDDDSIRAIISARGGYGTLRIVDKINFTKFIANPKWVIGYSDMTVLHAHIEKNFSIETLHAPMVFSFQKNADSLESLRRALFGELKNYSVKQENSLMRNGEAEGILTGGNLSLIYALTGSVSDIETKGKILFLEDLDEYLYHMDRMMLHLKRAGKLENLAGLLVGGMTDMKDNTIPFGKTAEEIIFDAVAEYDFPVCFNFPAGHDTKNFALYLGRKIKLNVGENISVEF